MGPRLLVPPDDGSRAETGFCCHESRAPDEQYDDEERWAFAFLEEQGVDICAVGDQEGQQNVEAGHGLRPLAQGVLVDTGAGATLADGSAEFPEFQLEPSEGSARGQVYHGPGKNEVLRNSGQRKALLRLGQTARR